MAQMTTPLTAAPAALPVDADRSARMAVVAWVLTAVYYFYQYALRSPPAGMMPQLSSALGITPPAGAAIVGVFYYGYSPFSPLAGAAMDPFRPPPLPPGAAGTVGVGRPLV